VQNNETQMKSIICTTISQFAPTRGGDKVIIFLLLEK
jgi:hypothetical protein